MPIDVLEAVPGELLVLRVHTAPGLGQTLTFALLPTVAGGSDVRVSAVVEGLSARPAAGPLWLSSAFTLRLLLARTERIANRARAA